MHLNAADRDLKCRQYFLDNKNSSGIRDKNVLPFSSISIGLKNLTRTEEGLEEQFACNYFGPFLLTNLLLGKFKSGSHFLTAACSNQYSQCSEFFDLYVLEEFDKNRGRTSRTICLLLPLSLLADKPSS